MAETGRKITIQVDLAELVLLLHGTGKWIRTETSQALLGREPDNSAIPALEVWVRLNEQLAAMIGDGTLTEADMIACGKTFCDEAAKSIQKRVEEILQDPED